MSVVKYVTFWVNMKLVAPLLRTCKKMDSNNICILMRRSPKATVTLVPVWKRGVSKQGILKSLVSDILNFKSRIKLIYDKITCIYCVINEFNPTYEVQKMGNEVFQNALFINASFPNGHKGNSCL